MTATTTQLAEAVAHFEAAIGTDLVGQSFEQLHESTDPNEYADAAVMAVLGDLDGDAWLDACNAVAEAYNVKHGHEVAR